jgi:hypothetical protein
MRLKLPRKLYPLFAAFFALSLLLGACNGDDVEIGEDNGIEEGIGEEGELGEEELEEEDD